MKVISIKHNADIIMNTYQIHESVKNEVVSKLREGVPAIGKDSSNVKATVHTIWDWEPNNIVFKNLKEHISEEIDRQYKPGFIGENERRPLHCSNFWLNVYEKDHQSLLGNFLLPRQRSGKRFCIADFYNDLNNNQPTDYLPMQAVTMGESASEFSHKLFSEDSYSDYLFFHGLTVQLAEALAEYIHSIIRIECGFNDIEPDNIKDILDVKYRGCRYSFGYPACPEVSDSRKQLVWLDANKINISMDESEQLNPEQSTTAIVALLPVAKYFGI